MEEFPRHYNARLKKAEMLDGIQPWPYFQNYGEMRKQLIFYYKTTTTQLFNTNEIIPKSIYLCRSYPYLSSIAF
jgi:hypothetical protein